MLWEEEKAAGWKGKADGGEVVPLAECTRHCATAEVGSDWFLSERKRTRVGQRNRECVPVKS